MTIIKKVFLSVFILMTTLPALSADDRTIYVIVNQQSELSELDQKQVMSLFLGRARNFPNGLAAKAFDYEIDSSIREVFFETLTGKQLSDIDAYWARLSYSGRAFPPKNLKSINEILEEVGRNKNAISYVIGKSPEELSLQGVTVVYAVKGRE